MTLNALMKAERREHLAGEQPLEYAKDLQVYENFIYIFMPKMTPEAEDLESRILIYNVTGTLLKQYVFPDADNTSFLYDFVVDKNNTIFFIDVMKAKILSFKPTVNQSIKTGSNLSLN